MFLKRILICSIHFIYLLFSEISKTHGQARVKYRLQEQCDFFSVLHDFIQILVQQIFRSTPSINLPEVLSCTSIPSNMQNTFFFLVWSCAITNDTVNLSICLSVSLSHFKIPFKVHRFLLPISIRLFLAPSCFLVFFSLIAAMSTYI